jgi:hypothetical protein
MNVSEVLRTLNQVPSRFPLQVEQGGVVHEILSAEYSHEPARAVLKIAEAEVTPEVRAKVEAAFTKWWHNEGSELRREGEEDIEEFVARATRIAWMNGAYVRRHASEFPAPLAEPVSATLFRENVALREESAKLFLEVERLKDEAVVWESTPTPSSTVSAPLPEPEATIAEANAETPKNPFAAFHGFSHQPVQDGTRSMVTNAGEFIAPEPAAEAPAPTTTEPLAGTETTTDSATSTVAVDPAQAIGRSKRARKPKSTP